MTTPAALPVARPAAAQTVFEVEGGGSSLLGGYGATANFWRTARWMFGFAPVIFSTEANTSSGRSRDGRTAVKYSDGESTVRMSR